MDSGLLVCELGTPFWALFIVATPARDGGREGSPAELADRFTKGAAEVDDVDGAAARREAIAENRGRVGDSQKSRFASGGVRSLEGDQLLDTLELADSRD